MKKPNCFGYYSPYDEECLSNCSFCQDCQKLQETELIEKFLEVFNKETSDNSDKSLKLEDIIIEDDLLD